MTSSSSTHCTALARPRRRPHRSSSGGGPNGNATRKEAPSVQLASAHVLTGLYALSHGLGLTAEESRLLEEQGMPLSPALWHETRSLLELADRGGAGTELDLGFRPALYAWLGISGDDEFIERFDVGPDKSLARDVGRLSALAAAVEGDRSRPLPLEVSHAWSARATRLMDGLPDTGHALLVALELSLDGARWEPLRLRPLFRAIAHVSELIGDEERLSSARQMLERLDRDAVSEDPDGLPVEVVAQVLTALWCLTHEGLLLEQERVFDPGIAGSLDPWAAIAAAARDGRVDDIPAPVPLLKAWHAPEGLTEEAVRDCLQRCAPLLPQIVAEVTRLWGGEAPDMHVLEEVARAVAHIALLRHHGLRTQWEPLLGEPSISPWLEVHQGTQRRTTLEIAELMRSLRPVLLRAKADPMVPAAAHLDGAAESSAEGKHDETRSHLEKAMQWTEKCEDPARRHSGAALLAQHLWAEGSVAQARTLLLKLEGEHPQRLLRTIEAHAEEREALREAEQAHAERADVDSHVALIEAEIAAGHTIHAEATARDALQHYPDDAKVWVAVARLLCATRHFRLALVPALEALDKGIDRTTGVALLARILSHLGSQCSEDSAGLAAEAIQAEDARSLPVDVLAELADIVHYAGPDITPARIVDDILSELCAEDPAPVEFLGAAVARRCCHGVWADDAPKWLARLSDVHALAPAALARFLVDRVEFLLWSRSVLLDEVDVLARARREEGDPDWADEPDPVSVREEAIGVGLRAAISLGYAEPDVDEEHEGCGEESEAARHWAPYLKSINTCFSDNLAIRMRASELAQAVWFGGGGIGESQLLVVLETFDRERLAWIRWVGEGDCEAIADLDAIAGITPSTRIRLQRVLESAELVEDQAVREARWITPWHEFRQC